MDAENATCVAAMRPNLLTETSGITQVANGQRLRGNPLIPVEGSNRLLWCGNQVFLIYHITLLLLLAALSYDLERTGKAIACYIIPYINGMSIEFWKDSTEHIPFRAPVKTWTEHTQLPKLLKRNKPKKREKDTTPTDFFELFIPLVQDINLHCRALC